jgi:hypothetical protein
LKRAEDDTSSDKEDRKGFQDDLKCIKDGVENFNDNVKWVKYDVKATRNDLSVPNQDTHKTSVALSDSDIERLRTLWKIDMEKIIRSSNSPSREFEASHLHSSKQGDVYAR